MAWSLILNLIWVSKVMMYLQFLQLKVSQKQHWLFFLSLSLSLFSLLVCWGKKDDINFGEIKSLSLSLSASLLRKKDDNNFGEICICLVILRIYSKILEILISCSFWKLLEISFFFLSQIFITLSLEFFCTWFYRFNYFSNFSLIFLK